MVSQFGSLGYTIMGKLLIWQLSRRQSLTPFTKRVSHKHSLPNKLAVHRVLYPSMLTESWVEGKSVEEKDAQSTKRTTALWGLSSKTDSRIWVNFIRNGLRLGSKHQEPPHTDLSKNLATVVVFLLLSHSWTTDNVRVTWAKEKKNWTVAQWSTVLFSDESKLCIVFGIVLYLESGGTVEKFIAQVA